MSERARCQQRARALLLVLTLAAAGAAAACGSESSVSTGPTQVKCQVALSTASPTIGADGGTGSVAVSTSAECPWDVTTGAAWVTGLSPTSGQGPGTVAFSVAPNPLAAARETDIVVNDNRVRVSQAAASCRYQLRPGALSMEAAGGDASVALSAPAACNWTIATDVDWINVTTPNAGAGDANVGLGIAPNPGLTTRVGTVVVGNERLTVSQAGASSASCVYTVALAPDVSVDAAGGVSTVPVTTTPDCAWAARSLVPWVVVAAGATGAGTGAVTFSVATNPGAARSGTIVVAGKTFTVTQAAAPLACTYAISSTAGTMPVGGGTGSIAVTAAGGCAWTASSNAPWITLTAGAAGSGNGAVAFTVAANTQGSRTGQITVAGQTYTVTQAAAIAAPCSFTISATGSTVPASGGTGNVTVASAAGCAWTATSNANWITVTAGATGSGDGAVAFTVAPNTQAARTGTLVVAGQTYTVTQPAASGPSCTFTIAPTSGAAPAPGGTGAVNVSAAAGCAWTAASNDAWITVTAGASGSGDGAVAYSVAPNTQGARTGTLVVAGQTYTVTQAAAAPAPCTFAIAPATGSVPVLGGTGAVNVTSAAGCTWTASSNDNWISITAGASGTGDGAVSYLATPNLGAARTGTLTIAGQTFTLSQAALICTYTLSATNANMNDKAGTGSVRVTAGTGCAWTAVSNDAWITVTSGASGSGNGTVAFSVPANNTKQERTGTITIAGRTFTIRQKD